MNAPAEACSDAELLRGRLMQRSLRALLDQVRGARDVLPHLAALEGALGEQGAAAVERIPLQFVGKVFRQLRVLPLPEDDAPLQDLVARLQHALRQAGPATTHRLSPFDPEATVVIMEGSHSDFMDALRRSRAPAPGAGA
ncbi:MAG: hypothetical protein GX886_16880 [Comamonadaceae bacterium]|nr:hypothetical protein [Rubrivivax sp.]NLZ42896.1 hypothetical protein [Comamonadaceae bacterium]